MEKHNNRVYIKALFFNTIFKNSQRCHSLSLHQRNLMFYLKYANANCTQDWMLNDTHALPQFTLTTGKMRLSALRAWLYLISVYGGKWSVGPYVFRISNYFMPVNCSVLMVPFVLFFGFTLNLSFQFNI